MATPQKQDIELDISRLEYNDATRPQRAVLTLETAKSYRGGLESDAKVYWVGKNFRSFAMSLSAKGGGDFSKLVLHSHPTVKATQKAIDSQHMQAFTAEAVAELVASAKAYYAAGLDKLT